MPAQLAFSEKEEEKNQQVCFIHYAFYAFFTHRLIVSFINLKYSLTPMTLSVVSDWSLYFSKDLNSYVYRTTVNIWGMNPSVWERSKDWIRLLKRDHVAVSFLQLGGSVCLRQNSC